MSTTRLRAHDNIFKIHEIKIGGIERRKKQIHRILWRPQHLSLSEIITSRYKVSKDTENLNTISQLASTDVRRVLHTVTASHYSKCSQNTDRDKPYIK